MPSLNVFTWYKPDEDRRTVFSAVHVWRCLVFLQQVAAHANEALRWMELYRLYQQQVAGQQEMHIKLDSNIIVFIILMFIPTFSGCGCKPLPSCWCSCEFIQLLLLEFPHGRWFWKTYTPLAELLKFYAELICELLIFPGWPRRGFMAHPGWHHLICAAFCRLMLHRPRQLIPPLRLPLEMCQRRR